MVEPTPKAPQLLPLIAGMFVAIMPIMTSPFIVGSAMDAIGITMAKAGWLGASALVPIALTSMASAPFLPRLPIRAFAVFCAAMLGFSYLGLAAVDAYWQYVCLSIFGGVGAGGLLAVIAMKVAQTPDPERVYGYIYTVTSIGFAALMFGLLPMREFAGVGAMFLVLAGLAAAPIPLLARLATSAPAAAAQSHEAASAERWPVILLFAVMTLAAPLNGGVYAFCERKAAELSLSAQATGTILSLTMICSIIGSVLVSWIATRPGRTIPTVVVLMIAGISYMLILAAQSVETYVVGMILYGLIQMAMNAYMFGLASALDRQGRVAGALQGYSLIPYALGAGLFGSLARGEPLAMLAWPSLIANLAAIAMLLPLLLMLDRTGRRQNSRRDTAPLAS